MFTGSKRSIFWKKFKYLFVGVAMFTEYLVMFVYLFICIQGVFEMRAQILTTSYWLHVELGKNI
jgi:hypothetical protein